MLQKRKLLVYISIILGTIVLGLALRHFSLYLPRWVHLYLGDFLWAFMIFFIFSIVFIKESTTKVIILSLIYCYLIEIIQLYHAPWIDSIRMTTVGHLLLGKGFLWTDIVSYTVGVFVGGFIDRYLK